MRYMFNNITIQKIHYLQKKNVKNSLLLTKSERRTNVDILSYFD
jgi:hypothetical protein